MEVEEILGNTCRADERQENCLMLLQTLLQLPLLSLTGQDSVVFVAVDFEYRSPHRISQIGISTFDTRDLGKPSPDPREFIHSRNFLWHHYNKAGLKFLFGESKATYPPDFRRVLEEGIFLKDADGEPRRIVLVGHDIYFELDLMRSVGIDFSDKKLTSGLLGILNTTVLGNAFISHHPIHKKGMAFTLSLKTLLEKLEIPFRYLHTAGNDAHFTLKAFIVLAVRSRKNAGKALSPDQEELMIKLEAIGYASIASELSGRTPDQKKYDARMHAKIDEKRDLRLKKKHAEQNADDSCFFASFADLEIGD